MATAAPPTGAEAPSPPPILQAAGHPLRWRLLHELARSDRRVHELTGLVGESQNLVSYHLAKLRDAGLVVARRSAADGRDTYYTADLHRLGASLAAAGSSLHPGLQVEPAPPRLQSRRPPVRLLFLCTGNSARSQIARALAEQRAPGVVQASSAGSHPKPLHPNAVRVLRDEYGLDISGRRPTHLDTIATERFDHVVTLCDKVREVCPELAGRPPAVHWSIPDPGAADPGPDLDPEATYPVFRQVAAEIDRRVGFLLAVLTHPQHREDHP